MFNSEREMQDIFVSLLKKRKTCGLIFEEVGNRNFFFRTDVVEYKDRMNIIGYELKLSDFKKLIKQSLDTLHLYDKNYIVVPSDKVETLLRLIKNHENNFVNKIGIIAISKDEYKIIKKATNDTKDYKNQYTVGMVQDMIIRGYHKEGINCCKNYK